MKKFALALFLLIATSLPAFSTTYYIATTGSDANAGTIGSPWASVVHAMNVVGPGDTVLIRTGTYYDDIREQANHFASGTAGNVITFKAYPGEIVTQMAHYDAVINVEHASYLSFEDMILDTTSGRHWVMNGDCVFGLAVNYPLSLPENHNTFKNLEIVGPYNDIIRGSGILGGHTDLFQNIIVRGFSSTAVYIDSDGSTLDGLQIYDNGISTGSCNGGNPGNGIQLYSAGHYPTGIVFKNSIVHNNLSVGILDVGMGNYIYNNISYGNGGDGIISGIPMSSGSQGLFIYNNTSYGNGGDGIQITGNSDSVVMVNNIAYNNVFAQITGTGTTPGTQMPNVTTNPSFVSAGTADFRLGSGSNAIGTGTDESAVFTTDIYGTTRTVPWDQGAIKYGGAAPPATGSMAGESISSRTVAGEGVTSRTIKGEFVEAQITLVTHATGTSANNNTAVTNAVTTTSANLIVCSASDYLSVSAGVLTDSKSNTWTAAPTYSGNITRLQTWWVLAPSVGSSHTFTYTATGSFPSLNCVAFSGVKTSSPLDTQSGVATTAVTSVQPGSVTPAADGALVISSVARDNSNPAFVNSGMTISDNANMTPNFSADMAYKIQVTAAAINPTWSWTSASDGVSNSIVFKAP